MEILHIAEENLVSSEIGRSLLEAYRLIYCAKQKVKPAPKVNRVEVKKVVRRIQKRSSEYEQLNLFELAA